eukprot:XP_001609734.1 hypothetical protein [Babesia bovis T2Bo]
MAAILEEEVPLGPGPGNTMDASPGPVGFRVYKRHCDRHRYERDFRRRLRNLRVAELRFGRALEPKCRDSPDEDCRVVHRVFSELDSIRPQLLECFHKAPDSIINRLRDLLGASLGIAFDVENNTGRDDHRSNTKHTEDNVTVQPPDIDLSSSQDQNFFSPVFVETTLSTLTECYDTIANLEHQVSKLTRENIDLGLKLSWAYSDICSMDMENAYTEQRYLESLTSLTESLYEYSTQCSKLQSLVLRQGIRICSQNRALSNLEKEAAKYSHLNATICPIFTKCSVNFGTFISVHILVIMHTDSDPGSVGMADSNEPTIERFFICEGDRTTSAYDSDGQGSVLGVSVPSIQPQIHNGSSLFYECGTMPMVEQGMASGQLAIGQYRQVPRSMFHDTSNSIEVSEVLRSTSKPVSETATMSHTADNEVQVAAQDGIPETVSGTSKNGSRHEMDISDTGVSKLKTENSALQKKLRKYLRLIRTLKHEIERLRPRKSISAELSAELSTSAVVPFGFRVYEEGSPITGIGPTTSTGLPPEDTKVKELKAEISALQDQIQRYEKAEEERLHVSEKLNSEERRSRELAQELTSARRRMASYHHEIEQILRSCGGAEVLFPNADRNFSSTAVSQNPDHSAKSGPQMSDLKAVFSSLQERLACLDSDNSNLRAELERGRSDLAAVHAELCHLRKENELLLSDTRAAGSLAMERVFHCVTSAMESLAKNKVEDLEGVDLSATALAPQVLDERTCALEMENRLYKEKAESLLDTLYHVSLERSKMAVDISRLNGEIHSCRQQLQKFSNQCAELTAAGHEVECLRAKCNIYSEQVERLKHMSADLTDLNNRLSDDVRSLEEKGAFARNESHSLREEVRQLQSLLIGDAKIAHDAIRDRVAIIELEGRCNILTEALTNGTAELDSLRSKNSNLIKMVMELRYSLEQERAANVENMRQVNSLSESEGRLRNQIERHETQMEGLRASVASLTESLEQSAADLRATQSRLAEKEHDEAGMASKIEMLTSNLKVVLTSMRDAKPLRLSPSDLSAVDISGLTHFNPNVYYTLMDSIQATIIDCQDMTATSSMVHDVTIARDKIYNILKCNYLLTILATGLCRQLSTLSTGLVDAVRLQGGSLGHIVRCLGDNLNLDMMRTEFSTKVTNIYSHVKELNGLLQQVQKSKPTDGINRLKEFYENMLNKSQQKLEQLGTLVKTKEKEESSLRAENSKLISDCADAANALHEFERRLEQLSNESKSLCSIAMSLMPSSEHSDCDRNDLKSILSALRSYISSLGSYKERYKKLLENPPEPKVITVTARPQVSDACVGTVNTPAQPPASTAQRAEPVPERPPVRSGPRLSRHRPTLDISVIKEVDANVRYYIKNIRSSLEDHVRSVSSRGDNSDTEYESPRSVSVGRSDATVCDDSDSDEDYSTSLSRGTLGEELVRRHTRQFESICDLVEQMRDLKPLPKTPTPHVSYADPPDNSKRNITPASDMAVMHHFNQLCSALKEYTIGTSMALSVDDVFYQMELVMLDQGDREHRRALWDRCVANLVSVVIQVLKTESEERQSVVDELQRRCNMVSSALAETNGLCRLREEELHRRSAELNDACSKLDELEQHCRKLEVELELRPQGYTVPDDTEIRALQTEIAQREDELRVLNKEVSKLHSVVIDLEEINGLLTQQISRLRADK